MRVRAFDSNGDYRFGGLNQFLVDTPEGVAQAILTRLRLQSGEWFLDLDEGTDYAHAILGYGTQGLRDLEVQSRILGTPGVKEILEYSSAFDPSRRFFTVVARVDTLYGEVTIDTSR